MFFIGFISDFQRALRFLSLCFSCFSFIKQRRQNTLPRRLIMWNKKVILIALISLDVDGKLITNPACYTYLSLKSFNCTRHVFITKHEDSYVSGKWSENEPRQKKRKEKEKEKEKVSFLARVSIFRKWFYLISFPISIYKHNQAFVSVRSHIQQYTGPCIFYVVWRNSSRWSWCYKTISDELHLGLQHAHANSRLKAQAKTPIS